MAQHTHETEIKLPAADVKTAQRRLRAAGFRVLKPRVFEANTVYDNPARALRRGAKLLRVREAGKTGTLTYKGPPEPGKHKSREELELNIEAPRMAVILERLGFQPVFRYEKYRTEYRQGRTSGTATVDETPIGVYIELEGEPEWIDRTAGELGYAEQDYITASYGSLFLDWRRKNRSTKNDMTFR